MIKFIHSNLYIQPSYLSPSDSTGDLYFGGPTDLLAKTKIFVRNTLATALETNQNHFVQTFIDNSKMLYSDAKFIYSFETKDYLYFLFKETSVESLICTANVTSRIGRVCKKDLGTTRSSMGRFWNTFIKARMVCTASRRGSKTTTQFDEIVDAAYLESESKLFAVFREQENGLRSADDAVVCVYDIAQIEEQFSESFNYQPSANTIWQRYEDRNAMQQFECKDLPTTEDQTVMSLQQNQRKYQIAYNTIDTKLNHLLIDSFFNFKQIQVDLIKELKPKSTSIYVVYLMTSDNRLARFLLNDSQQPVCLMSVAKVLPNGEEVLKFKFSANLKTLFIGSTNQLIKVQISNCEAHQDKPACLNRDPYCVWNVLSNRCEDVDEVLSNSVSLNHLSSYEQPNFSSFCQPIVPKEKSSLVFEKDIACSPTDDPTRKCLCNFDTDNSTRQNPFKISSCTVDGKWSEWSGWTGCRNGWKERTRECNNPVPANGGRACIGKTTEIENCLFLAKIGDWSACSARCGTGYRTRLRVYLNGDEYLNLTESGECRGEDCSRQECKCVECNDAKIDADKLTRTNCNGDECNYLNSMWTECGSSCAVGYQYKQIRSNVFRRRKCDRGVRCRGWSEWSEWSRCDGKSSRARYCYDGDCQGESSQSMLCDPENSTDDDYELVLRNETNTSYRLRTLLFCCLFAFISGIALTLAAFYVRQNKIYFKRDQTKNLSLRSVSSPLIRADKNTYVSNVSTSLPGRRSPDLRAKISPNQSNQSLKTETLSSGFGRSPLSSKSNFTIRANFKSPLTKEDQF